MLIEPGVPDDSCEYCRTGRYNICPRRRLSWQHSLTTKVRFAQYMTHPEEWTYHVPEGMTTMEAALSRASSSWYACSDPWRSTD